MSVDFPGYELAIPDPFSDGAGLIPAGWYKAIMVQCDQMENVQEVNKGRATMAGLVTHYRKLNRDVTELKKAELCTELRIGELLAPYSKNEIGRICDGLPYGAAWQLRRLAVNREHVLAWIDQGVDTRAALLAKITELEGAQFLPGLETTGQFQVIYADPPWRYEHTETPDVREIEGQYTTMTTDEIAKLPIPAAADSVLFLWATNPKLPDALQVMAAWGFEYRTNIAWVKDRIGMGYYVRGAHELLLIGKRGKLTVPLTNNRPRSWVEAPRGPHSVKPEIFAELIEQMYPDHSKLEMFARSERPGWQGWGHGMTPDGP